MLAFGTLALVILVRDAAEEGRALVSQINRFGELHLALQRVNQELRRSRVLVEDLRPK